MAPLLHSNVWIKKKKSWDTKMVKITWIYPIAAHTKDRESTGLSNLIQNIPANHTFFWIR